MRGAVLMVLLAGCSSESTTVPADLAAPACTFLVNGNAPGTPCSQRFCRQPTSDTLVLYDALPIGPQGTFVLAGPFTLGRGYTAAELQTFTVGYREGFGGPSYEAGSSLAGSTLTITITDVELSSDTQCGPSGNGKAHGTAHIGLVEALRDADAGVTSAGPGRLTVDATF